MPRKIKPVSLEKEPKTDITCEETFTDAFDGDTASESTEIKINNEKPKKLKVKKKKVKQKDAVRFTVLDDYGLTDEQVESRIIDGLTNKVTTKYTNSEINTIIKQLFSFNILFKFPIHKG